MARSPLACCSRSGRTTAGSSPVDAGLKKPVAAPVRPDSTAIAQIGGSPVISSSGEDALASTSRARSAATITVRRDTRSATTPPISSEPTSGKRAGRQHDADLGRDAAEVEHRERERDVDHPVAEHRDGERAEHEPEVAQAQDLEALRQARHGGAQAIRANRLRRATACYPD